MLRAISYRRPEPSPVENPPLTKPRKLAVGIGVATLACALLAAIASPPTSYVLAWTTLSCAIATVGYLANLPGVYGKREGRLVPWRSLPSAVFLLAFATACTLVRRWRRNPRLSEIRPGLWVGGRLRPQDLPPDTGAIVDLVAEFPEPRAIREHPGYRFLPVLDGHVPASAGPVLSLIEELADPDRTVVVHCDSGMGRAPTFAALLLLRRGQASDLPAAIEQIRRARPFINLGTAERRFLAAVERQVAAPANGSSPGPSRGGSTLP
jgi:protein-tyrosine phosphatase